MSGSSTKLEAALAASNSTLAVRQDNPFDFAMDDLRAPRLNITNSTSSGAPSVLLHFL